MDDSNRKEKTTKNRRIVPVIRWFVIIATPVLLTLWTVRLLIAWNAPSYPEFEYSRIDPDVYGFTDEERVEFAETTLEYLRENEPAEDVIYMLEDLRIADSNISLYNSREIGHMLDVKHLVDLFQQVFKVVGIFALAGIIYLLARAETRIEAYKAIMYGGTLTTAILLAMVILILIAWSFVFVQFHQLLFPPDTWSSSGLILESCGLWEFWSRVSSSHWLAMVSLGGNSSERTQRKSWRR